MARIADRKLVLGNSAQFTGFGFGAASERVFDIVCNSSVVGYQEIISDPSYAGKGVVAAYPVIGNYGITDEDFESKSISIGAMIVRENNDSPSNFRFVKTLSEALVEADIPGIEGVDTREIVRFIRDNGPTKAIITDIDTPLEQALAKINAYCEDESIVSRVSCGKKTYSRTANSKFNIAVIDCGVKHSLVSELNAKGCNAVLVPFDYSAEMIDAIKPDGIVVSNGPGKAQWIPQVSETLRKLKGKYPILAVGLGMRAAAIANGALIIEMKKPHRGGYAVRNLMTGKIESTSQNHGEAVNCDSLAKAGLVLTHLNVTDGTAEGFENKEKTLIAVEFNPESRPGPQDSGYILDRFIEMMKGAADNA